MRRPDVRRCLRALLLAPLAAPFPGAPALAAAPAISSVTANFAVAPPTLTITGTNLGGATTVRLGVYPALTLRSVAATAVTAILPSPLPPPGTYRVVLTVAGTEGGTDRIDVTLGAVGPQGPKGDKGDRGVQGAAGVLAVPQDCGARYDGANLAGCDLTGADLGSVSLTSANLSHANLIGANLAGAVLIAARLSGANLIGADLTDANLIAADLSGANLSFANVTGVKWLGTTCPDGTNSNANGNSCVGRGGGL